MKFTLHPRLKKDCFELGRFDLCCLLLMNDNQFPWFILVPQRPQLTEIHQLSASERGQLIEESCYLSEKLMLIYETDAMNIGKLGNIVEQLHLHHIVRNKTDKAWPGPVWGNCTAVPYSEQQLQSNLTLIKETLSLYSFVDDGEAI